MTQVPAICLNSNCNTLFASGFNLQNARNIVFKNCGASPCPKCGGKGKIPDGSYSVYEKEIFAFLHQAYDIALFKTIADTIQREINRKKSPKKIKKKLNKKFPKYKKLWGLISSEKKDALWYLGYIVKIIAYVATASITIGSCVDDRTKNDIINNSFHFNYHQEQPHTDGDNPWGNQIGTNKSENKISKI